MKSLFSLFTLVPASCICIAINCTAATNPDKPTVDKSSGTFTITLLNDTQIMLYGLQDIEMTQRQGDIMGGKTLICVASNVLNYKMAVDTTNKFKLKLNDNEIKYTLTLKKNNFSLPESKWGDGGLSGGKYSSEKLERDAEINESPASLACGADALQLEVELVPPYNVPGKYTDTVTVTVAPL